MFWCTFTTCTKSTQIVAAHLPTICVCKVAAWILYHRVSQNAVSKQLAFIILWTSQLEESLESKGCNATEVLLHSCEWEYSLDWCRCRSVWVVLLKQERVRSWLTRKANVLVAKTYQRMLQISKIRIWSDDSHVVQLLHKIEKWQGEWMIYCIMKGLPRKELKGRWYWRSSQTSWTSLFQVYGKAWSISVLFLVCVV